LIVAGCGDDGDDVGLTDTTTTTASVGSSSTTTAAVAAPTLAPGSASIAPPSPSSQVPEHWFAVEHRGDRFVLIQGTTDQGEIVDLGSMPDDFGAPDTTIPVSATDLAVSPDGAEAFVAFCCEPVSGAIFRFADGTGATPAESWDLGQQVAVRGTVIVRSDSSGTVRWNLDAFDPVPDETLPEAGAVDVAATGDEGAPVAVLAAGDPSSDGTGPDAGDLVDVHLPDATIDRTVGLDGPHCALVATSAGLVATAGTGDLAVDVRCVSDQFTVIDPDGATGSVQLPSALRDLEADATGDHLIGVDATGAVVRLAPGDEIQVLARDRDVVAVAW
jgi:hypothetical protein